MWCTADRRLANIVFFYFLSYIFPSVGYLIASFKIKFTTVMHTAIFNNYRKFPFKLGLLDRF